MSKSRRVFQKVSMWLIAIMAIGLYSWCTVLYADSFMPLWLPVTGAVVLAGITLPFFGGFWKLLLHTRSTLYYSICHVCIVGAVGAFIVLGGNYYGAPKSSAYTETATVTHKFSEKRQHKRRVGRHYYADGSVYYVYKVRLQYHDGKQKVMEVGLERYNRIRHGRKVEVAMQRGMFGYPVITGCPL